MSRGFFSVQYPARSRAISLSTPWTSALSGKLVIKGASPETGSGASDLTIPFNRNASMVGAHSETYAVPAISLGTFPVTATFYAGADQTGAVVGTITANVTLSCASETLTTVSLATKASAVTVTPVSLKVGGSAAQMAFTVTDSSGAVIPVSAGSATFASKGSAVTVTAQGVVTPVSAGTATVSATVDGITSPTVTITVAASSSTSYKIVDLGAGTEFADGRPLNDNGIAIFKAGSGQQLTVIDTATMKSTTLAQVPDDASINNSNLIVGNVGSSVYSWQGPQYVQKTVAGQGYLVSLNNLGNLIGVGQLISSTRSGEFWTSVTSSPTNLQPVGGDPNLFFEPYGINGSKTMVGIDFTSEINACYCAGPSAQPALLPTFGIGRSEARAINDSGVVAGFADSGSGEYAVIWPTVTSTPQSIGSIGAPGSAEAFGINNQGDVVGIDSNAAPSERPFVYRAGVGIKSVYDLADSSRTGWQLDTAVCINNNGWIYGQGLFNGQEHVYVAVPNP